MAALQVLSACSSLQQPLEELRKGIVKYPQQIVNVPTNGRIEKDILERLSRIVSQTEQALGDGIKKPTKNDPINEKRTWQIYSIPVS